MSRDSDGGRAGLVLPDAVRARAASLGADGADWLASLPDLIAALESDWDVTLGAVLAGGTAACVLEGRTGGGREVVVKIALPGEEDFGQELSALRIAGGRGYAALLRRDTARGAAMLERLGARLSTLGLSTERQIDAICATLAQAWITPPQDNGLPSTADKANRLGAFVAETWEALGRPCPVRVIDTARQFAGARAAAFDPARAVLIHGDAHADNTLRTLDGARFKFIDPDGLVGEQACDLAVPMRGWPEQLLAGDALASGRARCTAITALTGVDPAAIWQWGFLEMVATGLHATQVGFEAMGRDHLAVAETWDF